MELEPKIETAKSKAEALVRVAGEEIYVEAKVFTRKDPAFEATDGFWFDPAEQTRSESAVLLRKITDKAEQYRGLTCLRQVYKCADG